MPPFLGGGEMILNVTKEGFTTTEIPWNFEAGTPIIFDLDYSDDNGGGNTRLAIFNSAGELALGSFAQRPPSHDDECVCVHRCR